MGEYFANDITVYAKWNEDDSWYSSGQKILYYHEYEQWSFQNGAGTTLDHTKTMSGDIGYTNVGLIVGSNQYSNNADTITSGQDENSNSSYYESVLV